MFYKIKDNVFNLKEVLYVQYNGVNLITIAFNNNTSALCIDFGDGCKYEEVRNKSLKAFTKLCDEFVIKNKDV